MRKNVQKWSADGLEKGERVKFRGNAEMKRKTDLQERQKRQQQSYSPVKDLWRLGEEMGQNKKSKGYQIRAVFVKTLKPF